MNEQQQDSSGTGNEHIEDKAKQLFDESVQGLDGQTLSRLNRGRQRAIAELRAGSGFQSLSPWVPAAGVTAAAVFAVVLLTGEPPKDDLSATSIATDFEILLDADSIDMLEDLEFYSWLDLDAELDALDKGENVG